MKKIFKITIAAALAFGLSACSSESSSEKNVLDELKQGQNAKPKRELGMSREALYELIHQIPSPLEISKLIHESGASYNEDMLNDVDNSGKYTSRYRQAVNLGVYGTNLGYINMYSNYTSSLTYLGAVTDLAEELKVSQFFDFNTIKRLAINNENMDSILHISTTGFDRMNEYLQNEGRDEHSVLMLIGGWIEAVHVLCQVTEKTPSEELVERIGEQKLSLEFLNIIIDLYQDVPFFQEVKAQMKPLNDAFGEVTQEVTEGELIEKEVDGTLVIEDTSTSKTVLSDATLKKITTIVANIRTLLIKVEDK